MRIFFNNATFNNSTLIFNNNTITGATGADGGGTVATGVAAFGCVFDFQATSPQTIPETEDVLYNSNGPLHEISHKADTSDIVVNLAGVYNIDFSVYTVPNLATLRTGATGAWVQIDKVDSFQSFDSKLPSDSTSWWTVLPLANGWHYQPPEV